MLKSPLKYGLNEKGKSRIQTIVDSTERATNIVKELLEFATFSQTAFQQLNLQTLFANSLKEINESDFKKCTIEFSFPSRNIYVWGNPKQLENVITKIVLNSFQAIQEEQKIHPELNGKIKLSGKWSGNNVIASITDNGIGVSSESAQNIFNPFYTTKEPGAGVGLGLSICHRIMTEHTGSIKVISLDKGTEVQLVFPKEMEKYV